VTTATPDVGYIVGGNAEGEIPFRDHLVRRRRRTGGLGVQNGLQAGAAVDDARAFDLAVEMFRDAKVGGARVGDGRVGAFGGNGGSAGVGEGARDARRLGLPVFGHVQAFLARCLAQMERACAAIVDAGNVVPGVPGQWLVGVHFHQFRCRGQPTEGAAQADAQGEGAALPGPAQHRLRARLQMRGPYRRREGDRSGVRAEIERRHIHPGAEGNVLLLAFMLALLRPGDVYFAVAWTFRVRIAAQHAGDAGGIPPAAAHPDLEADLLTWAHAPAIDIAGDIKHRGLMVRTQNQARRTFQNRGRPFSTPVSSFLYAVGWKNTPSGT
jgi:hypothetical protein